MTEHILFEYSSENMHEIDDNKVHLIVTSPPYNVDKEYNDNLTYQEYYQMLFNVFSECYRVLVTGGRIAVNIANIDRNPYRPYSMLIYKLLTETKFDLFGEIIWQKWSNANTTAWGSYMKDGRPYLRDVHEYIIVASKGRNPMTNNGGEMTITKNEFLQYTSSVWKILPANSSKHPAIYPEEIPRRLIKLFTRTNAWVLDPFGGSGTTTKVARELDRNSYTFEIYQPYFDLIREYTDTKFIVEFFDSL